MRLVTICVILLIFNCKNSNSQELSKVQRDRILKDLSYYIFSDTGSLVLNLGEMTFLDNGIDSFYNPFGFHLLYKIKNNNIERLDRSCFHGHNYGRFLYSYKGDIYLMGGYGFFTSNNIVEKFDTKLKEWNFVSTKGDRPDYINGIIFKKDSLIYLFNSFRAGNNAEPDFLLSDYFIYNVHSNTWTKKANNNEFSNIVFSRNHNFKNYVLSISLESTLIINKRDLSFILLSNNEIPISFLGSLITKINGDKLYYTHSGSLEHNRYAVELDVDSVFMSHSKEVQQIKLNSADTTSTKYLIYFFMLIIIVTVVLILRKNKHNSSPLNEGANEITNIYIQKLSTITGESITVDELDELLAINHMEAESKKSKRHRIINQLNEEYPGIIIRKKDEEDKRRFLYLIDKKAFIKM